LVEQFKPISQYIKDLSFENYAAQKNEFDQNKLDLNIDLNIKTKNLKADLIEITLVILLEANVKNTKTFIIELSYASTFFFDQSLTKNERRKISLVDCPNLMFPFVRQIIFNITRDSGFLPINLEYINFLELFNAQNSP
tara:strand:- start:468 stop:884 length:417 start_codon:yes stop_codon:yes gene_type:complete